MSDPMLSPHPRALATDTATAATVELVLTAWVIASPQVFLGGGREYAIACYAAAAVIAVASFATLIARRRWMLWIAGAAGVWLLMVPAVLRVPSVAASINATITGVLVTLEGLVYPITRILRARLAPPRPPGGRSASPPHTPAGA